MATTQSPEGKGETSVLFTCLVTLQAQKVWDFVHEQIKAKMTHLCNLVVFAKKITG